MMKKILLGLFLSFAISIPAYSTDYIFRSAATNEMIHPSSISNSPTINTVTPGDSFVIIDFLYPTDNGGSIITGYTASCGDFSVSGALTPLTINGLTNGTNYDCSVLATNAKGNSTPSAIVSVTPAREPDAPIISTAQFGNKLATVSFSAPANNGGSPITSYTATCGTETASGTNSPLVVTGLTNGTTYDCSVSANNAAGTSLASSTQAVTPGSVPSKIYFPYGLTYGDTTAQLAFQEPYDGGRPILKYRLECISSTGIDRFFEGTATNYKLTVNNLTNGAYYNCKHSSYNELGWSEIRWVGSGRPNP